MIANGDLLIHFVWRVEGDFTIGESERRILNLGESDPPSLMLLTLLTYLHCDLQPDLISLLLRLVLRFLSCRRRRPRGAPPVRSRSGYGLVRMRQPESEGEARRGDLRLGAPARRGRRLLQKCRCVKELRTFCRDCKLKGYIA